MDISQQIFSDIITFQKYAKHIPTLQRRETWEEICDRNSAMHIKRFPSLTETVNWIYDNQVKTKKVLPSMRSMQFGGRPIELNNSRMFNCCLLPVDNIIGFSETMFLLLGGCGVGYSVQKHHVQALPPITGPKETRRRFLIGDSIEGWSEAVKVLFKAYTENKANPDFDFRDIRPKGALLVTAGGKAPGPEPLRICLEKIRASLNGAIGRQLTTIEAHDIMCHIADAVLSGGIRRAAMIAFFSFDDLDMLTCKSGLWYELNPQRGRANNSAVLERDKITHEQFKAVWQRVEESNAGEPGVYWTNDKDVLSNPCVEATLRMFSFCVAEDTKLITRNGIANIASFVGSNVDIWNGSEWTEVTPRLTAENQTLYRVHLSDGSYLDCSAGHKWSAQTEAKRGEWREMTTESLMTSKSRTIRLEAANVVAPSGGISVKNPYTLGFAYGDGYYALHGAMKTPSVIIDLHGVKQNLPVLGRRDTPKLNFTETSEYSRVYAEKDIDANLFKSLRDDVAEWNKIGEWAQDDVLEFFAGLADADGSSTQGGGIRIYIGCEERARLTQLILTKNGVMSSVNIMAKRGSMTNFGPRQCDIWYLQITDCGMLPCHRLDVSKGHRPRFKGKYQTVRKIEKLEGLHNTYCFTEPKKHKGLFGNVLTYQCNLTTTNVSDVEDQKDLEQRVAAAAYIGTLQASYTDFHYLRPEWRRVTEEDALIGVSMTGIASGKVLGLNLEEAAKIVVYVNKEVAKQIGINQAARTSLLKPEGTATIAVGGAGSGIHAAHDMFFKRRMRVGKNEPLYFYLLENHPAMLEDCHFKPHLESIVTIPQKAPEGCILRDESPMDLLKRVLRFNKEWIAPGHNRGVQKHNVSCTISLKPDEWEACGEWMWENRNEYNGISVLPWDGGSYIQAPFESCTEEEYNAMMENLHAIDLTRVKEIEDATGFTQEIACSGGACEVQF